MPTEVNQCPPLSSYSPAPSEWRKRSHAIPVIEPRYESQGGYPVVHGYPYYPHGHSHYIPVCERGYESAYDSSPDREIPPSYPTSSGRRIEPQKSFGDYNPPWYDDPGYYRSHVYKSRSVFKSTNISTDIRDRSVLRINEQSVNGEEGFNSSCDQELSYFSEPELDSEYHHQHIHRAKVD
ncbi:uncharacterized protein LOC111089385 [Limulus polyphemus]|uniref:Uncharacterized protein LOC111089385 n=1 Tax=Limulus polyphemus TaxID=6850 RepID=A0ABM1TNP3_LIMPO|nr:uncharacterized protein LOC111089385 [Limulus polyphemus]